MRKILILLFLSMMVCLPFAYTLAIKVTVTDGTLSVGSNVSLENSGVEIAAGRTGSDGVVTFNVSNGSYFAILKSSIYPLQVTLIEVNGDTSVSLSKRELISYATAYGQVTGPTDFSNCTVAAFQNGLISGRTSTDGHGYYMLSFLPEGPYTLVFNSPGFGSLNKSAYLPLGSFTEVNAAIPATQVAAPPQPQQPALSAPSTVQQSSIITVTLSGESPIYGQTIIAMTPAGKVEITTDSQGRASLNAAQSGLYVFTFGTLSASTAVEPSSPAPVQQPSTPVTQPAAAPAPTPAPEQPAQSTKASILAAVGLFFIIVIVALLALFAWVKYVAPALSKEKRHGEHMHHEHHGHEGHEMHAGHEGHAHHEEMHGNEGQHEMHAKHEEHKKPKYHGKK